MEMFLLLMNLIESFWGTWYKALRWNDFWRVDLVVGGMTIDSWPWLRVRCTPLRKFNLCSTYCMYGSLWLALLGA
jgi:hypothetical protein